MQSDDALLLARPLKSRRSVPEPPRDSMQPIQCARYVIATGIVAGSVGVTFGWWST